MEMNYQNLHILIDKYEEHIHRGIKINTIRFREDMIYISCKDHKGNEKDISIPMRLNISITIE